MLEARFQLGAGIFDEGLDCSDAHYCRIVMKTQFGVLLVCPIDVGLQDARLRASQLHKPLDTGLASGGIIRQYQLKINFVLLQFAILWTIFNTIFFPHSLYV